MTRRFTFSILLLFAVVLCRISAQPGQGKLYPVKLRLPPGRTIEAVTEMLPEARLDKISDNLYGASLSASEITLLRKTNFEVQMPKTEISKAPVMKLSEVRISHPHTVIGGLVNSVSRESLATSIIGLQNFGTRYEYTPQQDSAGAYIYKEFLRWGLQAEYDTYSFGTTTVYDVDFISEDTGWAAGTGGMIIYTTSGGATWLNNSSGLSQTFYGVDFYNSSRGWAVGAGGVIYRSTDGGLTWGAQTSGVTNALYDVGFASDRLGLIVGTAGRILRTTNGGVNWSSVTSGTSQTLRAIKFVDTLRAWAVGTDGTILRTTNGGVAWVSQASPLANYLRAVDFVDTLKGWIAGEGGTILKTTNGGINWIQKTPPAGIGTILRGISFISAATGWIVDYEGRILSTTDGGENWNVQYARLGWNSYLLNIQALNQNRIAACGVSGLIYSSTNNGTSWISQTSNLPAQYIHTSRNVVATIPGSVTPQNECVMVAHYDCYSENPYVSAPGANDNATGTAAVMEAARICKGHAFSSTLKFVAVSGEELGMYGSDHYAYKARDEGKNILGAVNGDMIGYPTTPDTARLVISSYEIPNRLVDSAALYNSRYSIGLTLVSLLDSTGASDYGPFALAGYDALDVAEATANEIWGGADPYYHQTTDTFDKLNMGLVRRGAQLMLATVAELARPVSGHGSISGMKFGDIDGDSVKDLGETGISGWKIYASGASAESTLTDADGYYIFDNLPEGDYALSEETRAGWIQSYPLSGFYSIHLSAGDSLTEKDFGNFRPNSVSGTVWSDRDGDGSRGAGETGIQGWKVSLGGPKRDSVFTDLLGHYTFHDLPSGIYSVREENREGWLQTFPGQPGIYTLSFSTGQNDTGKNFGNLRCGSISGITFYDKNSDGIKESGEAVLPGWKIMLSGTKNDSVLTDSLGRYSFGNLSLGSYAVTQAAEPGWTQTLPPQPGIYSIVIDTGGTDITNADFGNYSNIAISVRKLWNIVSLNRRVTDSRTSVLFPTASSSAFSYEGIYKSCDTLTNGAGYWLRFDSSEVISLAGSPVLNDTISVAAGWNLIGSISEAVPLSSVVSDPPGMITGHFYGYSGSYYIADTILPGNGYWLKSNQAGSIILSPNTPVYQEGRIRISATNELPPPPPAEFETENELPPEYALQQAYPNPFNPTTVIFYQLPVESRVTLKVYGMLGQVVATLADEVQTAGFKSVEWNAIGLASGIYLYRIEAQGANDPGRTFSQVKKIILLR